MGCHSGSYSVLWRPVAPAVAPAGDAAPADVTMSEAPAVAVTTTTTTVETTTNGDEPAAEDDKKKRKLKIDLFSCSGTKHTIEDFSQIGSKESRVKLPDGRPGFKSGKLGLSQMQGSQPQESIFAIAWKSKEQMLRIKIYHGASLDGIEFCYEDGRTELFGKRGGKEGGSVFALDTRMGETILGFYLRAGAWIDGIQILTSAGRKSEIYGNDTGGSG